MGCNAIGRREEEEEEEEEEEKEEEEKEEEDFLYSDLTERYLHSALIL